MVETSAPLWIRDAALVEVAPPEIIHATGGDRVAFLHRLLTANVEGVSPGSGTRALLLDTKGRIVADFGVCVRADEVTLIVPAGQGATAAAALSRYAIMDDFTAAPDPSVRALAVHGARAAERLAVALPVPDGFLARPQWSHEEVTTPAGPAWLVRARAFGTDGLWLFGAPDVRSAVEQALSDLPRPTADEIEAARIRAGEPRWGVEITAEYFPMEIGLDAAIDYGKGCYLGQEPIVRIRDRGHLNWRLASLALDGDVTPAAGDLLESDAKPRAGRITSAASTPTGAVALALVHVSVPDGGAVRVKHADTAIEARVVPIAALRDERP